MTKATKPKPKAKPKPKPDSNGKTVRNSYALEAVAVEKLRANPWNPNRMEPDEFDEYCAEVKHLGRLPKPCVVRRSGDDFEIIDGEHGWRAALKLGFPAIDCEIIGADDFEAMRQTYKRNQHGKHDPVLQGRMFRQMREQAGLSNRELGRQMEVSEGTVRNSILWADAFDLRNSYAPETAERDLQELNLRQLRWYMELPAPIRDYWLDRGARADEVSEAAEGFYPVFDETLQQFVDRGLACLFIGRDFQTAIKQAREFCEWRDAVIGAIPDVDDFLRPLLEHKLPLDFLNFLPYVRREGETPPVVTVISADEWRETVNNCCQRAENEKERDAMMRASIRLLVKQKGVELQDLTDPRILEAIEGIKDAPDFIKNAEHMDLEAKWWLHRQQVDELDDAALLEAKQEAVDWSKMRFDYLTGSKEVPQGDEDARNLFLGEMYCRAVDVVFPEIVTRKIREKKFEEAKQRSTDDEKLLAALVERFKKDFSIREGTVDGKPAFDVLRERLAALPKPEFRLLACELLKEAIPAIQYLAVSNWLESIGGKRPPPRAK